MNKAEAAIIYGIPVTDCRLDKTDALAPGLVGGLLAFAEKEHPEDYPRAIARKLRWPFLYHFSQLRPNLLAPLPIRATDRVLELGAECGALTAGLAAQAAEVVSVEPSMGCCRVNAARNKDCCNLRILAGSLAEALPYLEGSFDVITLLASSKDTALSFAGAGRYLEGEEPHRTLLAKLSAMLKPKGRIAIAIENRLGLKYWAGCREPHYDNYFAGIEGYPEGARVRTFSRRELLALIESAGDFETALYYPWPDHIFTTDLYTDRFLPRAGELKGSFRCFDGERLLLFDEQKTLDSLIGAGLFGEFASSFLAVLYKEEPS